MKKNIIFSLLLITAGILIVIINKIIGIFVYKLLCESKKFKWSKSHTSYELNSFSKIIIYEFLLNFNVDMEILPYL